MDDRRGKLLQRLCTMQRAEEELLSVRAECKDLRTELAEAKSANERLANQQKSLVSEFADRGKKMESLMRQLVEERNRLAAQVCCLQEKRSMVSQSLQTLSAETEPAVEGCCIAVQVTPESSHCASQTAVHTTLEQSNGTIPLLCSPTNRKNDIVSVFPTSPSFSRSLQVPWVLQAPSETPSSLLLALAVAIREKSVIRVVEEANRRYVALCDRGWWRWYVVDKSAVFPGIEAWDEGGEFIEWPSAVQSALREYGRSRPNGIADMGTTSLVRLIACLSVEGPFRWTQLDIESISQSVRKREHVMIIASYDGDECMVNDIAEHDGGHVLSLVHAADGRLHGQWVPLDTVVTLFEFAYFCKSEPLGTKDVRLRTLVDDGGYADVGLWFPANLCSSSLNDRVIIRFVDRAAPTCDLDGSLVPVGYESFAIMCPALKGSRGRDCVCAIFVRRWATDDPIRFGFVSRPKVDEHTGMISLQHCIVAAQIDGNDVRTSTVERFGFASEAEKSVGLAVISMGRDVATSTELNVMDDVVGDDYRLASHRNLVGEMQLLQLDFNSLEASALRRAMTLLDGRTAALLQHDKDLFAASAESVCGISQHVAFAGAGQWLTAALELCNWKFCAAINVLFNHVSERASRINTDLRLADCIAHQSLWWASARLNDVLNVTKAKSDTVMDDMPRVGITATAADFTFPSELLAIELAEMYTDMCFSRLADAARITSIVVSLFVEQNLAFVHHTVTLLDEMDDKIAELQNLLVRPLNADKETMARSNLGDIATSCSEIAKLKLQLSTVEEYLPALLQHRNDLLEYKARADVDLRASVLQIEAVNDRCGALSDECESLTKKLESAGEYEKGLILRLQNATERIDQLQLQVYESDRSLVKIESEKQLVVDRYEAQLQELIKSSASLKTENELLKEGLEAVQRPLPPPVGAQLAPSVQKGKSITPRSKPAVLSPSESMSSASVIEKIPNAFPDIPMISVSTDDARQPTSRDHRARFEQKPSKLQKTMSMRSSR